MLVESLDVMKFAGLSALIGILVPRKTSALWGLFEKKKEDMVKPGDDGLIRLMLSDEKYSELRKAGGVVKVGIKDIKRPVVVKRTGENEVSAISSECTHMGCEVGIEENGGFKCPCHGAEYNKNGEVIKGPAEYDLETFETKLNGDEIIIDVSKNEK